MAKLRASVELVEEFLFGFSANPVRITGLTADLDQHELVFEIEGADVPDAPHVQAILNLQTNRAGQRLITLTFQPMPEAK